jgi:hypothetical protein
MTRMRMALDLGCNLVLSEPRRAGGLPRSPARAEVRPKTNAETRGHVFTDSEGSALGFARQGWGVAHPIRVRICIASRVARRYPMPNPSLHAPWRTGASQYTASLAFDSRDAHREEVLPRVRLLLLERDERGSKFS